MNPEMHFWSSRVRHIAPLAALLGLAGCASNNAPNAAPGTSLTKVAPKNAAPAPLVVLEPVVSAAGYEITPPPNWQINQKGPAGVDLILSAAAPGQSAGHLAASLNVVIAPAAPGETLDKSRAQINAAQPKMLTGYKQIAQGSIKLDGVPAFFNTATHQAGTPPRLVRMHQVFVLKNNKAYAFTCGAPDAQYARYESDFQTALKSVRWTK